MQLKIDPEFQSFLPPLPNEKYRQLEENIKTDGCMGAIITWNGTIVDGHNRYRICQENNIPFNVEEKEFADRDEAIEWVIRNQFGRRDLSPAQRSELALKLKPMIQKRAKENQKAFKGNQYKTGNLANSPKKQPANTREELAKIAGVSSNTLGRVEVIHKKGNPEQIERARKGGKGNSVNAIYKEVTGKTAPVKDRPTEPEKFDFTKLSRKERRQVEQEVVDALKNPNRVRKRSARGVVEEIEANLSIALRNLESSLNEYAAMPKDKEDNPKIIAVLSEAETAIKKLKGKYLYE